MARGAKWAVLIVGLSALGLAPSPAVARPSRELVLESLALRSSNGYEIEVVEAKLSGSPPEAELSAERRGLRASYSVPADFGPGIQATFGSLGVVSAKFERHGRKVKRPEEGCEWITETGVYRGSFSFSGEDGYTTVATSNPQGEVLRLPDGFCGLGGDRAARIGLPPALQPRATVLLARADVDRGQLSFSASRLETAKREIFRALLLERVGPMKITRSADAIGGVSAFASSGSRSAGVRPPAPFAGTASFRRPEGEPASWNGSLSVSFPGAPGIALAGEGFSARLCPNRPLLSPCWPSTGAGEAAPAAPIVVHG